jgi:integrase
VQSDGVSRGKPDDLSGQMLRSMLRFAVMSATRQPTNVQFLYTLNGTFYARTYANGREKWTSLRTKVKAVARRKLAELLADHHEKRDARRDVESGSATVGQLLRVHLERERLRTDLRDSSKELKRFVHQSIVRSWPEVEDKLPNRVTEHEIAEWAQRHHAKHSPSHHNAALYFVRSALEIAVDRGTITHNPAAKLVRATEPRTRLELPTADQFKRMVALVRTSGSSHSKASGDLIEFLAYTGLRISEARRVKWKDVDTQTNRLWVEPGKSGHGRHIPLNPQLADLLRRIKDEKRFALLREERFGHVLVNTTAVDSLGRASKEVFGRRLTHHKLRHYFATRTLQSGVPVATVANWLGHSDGGALLLRTYSHLLDAHSQEMAQRVSF